MRASAKKFLANWTFQRFLFLSFYVGVRRVDELVVGEVGGVAADSAAGGALEVRPATGAGARVTSGPRVRVGLTLDAACLPGLLTVRSVQAQRGATQNFALRGGLNNWNHL